MPKLITYLLTIGMIVLVPILLLGYLIEGFWWVILSVAVIGGIVWYIVHLHDKLKEERLYNEYLMASAQKETREEATQKQIRELNNKVGEKGDYIEYYDAVGKPHLVGLFWRTQNILLFDRVCKFDDLKSISCGKQFMASNVLGVVTLRGEIRLTISNKEKLIEIHAIISTIIKNNRGSQSAGVKPCHLRSRGDEATLPTEPLYGFAKLKMCKLLQEAANTISDKIKVMNERDTIIASCVVCRKRSVVRCELGRSQGQSTIKLIVFWGHNGSTFKDTGDYINAPDVAKVVVGWSLEQNKDSSVFVKGIPRLYNCRSAASLGDLFQI